ncbi:hypothetical protein A2707_02240 [Candidatus Saccharibacteria bacterium RIFCSPHIGHO2_01_FULL_45_15]|nr:MAG: hypothetical protein A2707_02240 [Candidatus Saccharibacteria bacterium RIFCSPHIGHO2_01_FULL_45_15]OGL28727.1 MAG: hypothetical protein A3C39_00070 [Candidatus Saccharibacteria bacterium RIFCSPHIGHO2_02_FULL_46_12]OGL32572.1 MAG: hypothetical protein A3E76_06480 [Candidatus Saccharibacteria bacterium RIFCSPHIGHO2_12_FULL_44_22]
MSNIINTILGSLDDKRDYKNNETRAKTLPNEYRIAYKEIKHYIFQTSGITDMKPLVVLVDMFEEAAAHNRQVLEITGSDVAAFADELVRGETSYHQKQRQKLNTSLSKKLGDASK